MTLLLVVVGIAVVAGTALLLVRDRPLLVEEPDDDWRLPGHLPADDAEGLATATFRIVLRGYRMDQVDRTLEGATQALRRKEDRIAALEGEIAALRAGFQAGGATGSTVDEG